MLDSSLTVPGQLELTPHDWNSTRRRDARTARLKTSPGTGKYSLSGYFEVLLRAKLHYETGK